MSNTLKVGTGSQMDQVTQQNAALVEEAAAESLQDQAGTLTQVVSVFKLDGTYTVAAPAARGRSAPPAKMRVTPIASKARPARIAGGHASESRRLESVKSGTDGDWDEF